MKKTLLLSAVVFFAASIAVAGPKPQSGTIISQTSVACGSKKSKKTDIDLMCQQYVVRAATIEYTIRQQKPSDQALIPPNTPVTFTIDKNKMKFKVNDKSFEYLVTGQAALSSAAPTQSAQPSQP
jgi:hypothetical protein